MVSWYHAIFSAYGFWLPNDPRGSWSTFVGAWELFRFGPATKTHQRRSLARDPHDVRQRLRAKRALKYPPVRFSAEQRESIARGFAFAVRESNILLHACCIGYDHVHVVTARHAKSIERVVGHLKGRATQAMKKDECHPDCPSAWSEGCWRVYIDDEAQLRSAVQYVQRHPVKEGLVAQEWEFVTPVA